MPSLLTLEKIDHDMELEWLLCLASRFQTYERLRPTEIGGIQRSKEFPTLTTSSPLGENPRGPQFWTESTATKEWPSRKFVKPSEARAQNRNLSEEAEPHS
jgi:hypothetical protein